MVNSNYYMMVRRGEKGLRDGEGVGFVIPRSRIGTSG